MDIEKVDRILEEHEYKHSAIISIMQDVQDIENYLPEETIRYISDKLELNLTRIFDLLPFTRRSVLCRGVVTGLRFVAEQPAILHGQSEIWIR